MSNNKFVFTIDNAYNVKAILTSLPHVIFKLSANTVALPRTTLRHEFENWRHGNYIIDSSSTDNKLVIRGSTGLYTFVPIDNLQSNEMLWLFVDELKLTNQKLDSQTELINILKESIVNTNKSIKESKESHEPIKESHEPIKDSISDYRVVNVDYRINTLSIDVVYFNNYMAENVNNYIIGIRGYWIGTSYVNFNITQVLCRDGKFESFNDIKLINNRIVHSNASTDNTSITAHDILGSFSNLSLKFYYDEIHIMSIDLNNFISKSVNAYLEGNEHDVKTELTKKFYETTDCTLSRIEYKTSIVLDTTKVDGFNYLNSIMETRNMQIIEGGGHWVNPILFLITSITFKPLEETQQLSMSTQSNEEEFETVNSNELAENKSPTKNNLAQIRKINKVEKFYGKNPTTPGQIILNSNNSSPTNYNTHLLLSIDTLIVGRFALPAYSLREPSA